MESGSLRDGIVVDRALVLGVGSLRKPFQGAYHTEAVTVWNLYWGFRMFHLTMLQQYPMCLG